MIDLYPTKTRLDLLQDVKDGLICTDGAAIWRDERLAGIYDPITATRTKVTSRAHELEQAGWIKRVDTYSYRITDAGREVLAGGAR